MIIKPTSAIEAGICAETSRVLLDMMSRAPSLRVIVKTFKYEPIAASLVDDDSRVTLLTFGVNIFAFMYTFLRPDGMVQTEDGSVLTGFKPKGGRNELR